MATGTTQKYMKEDVNTMKVLKLEYVDRCPSCNFHFYKKDALEYKVGMDGKYAIVECPNCQSRIRIDPKDGREVIYED